MRCHWSQQVRGWQVLIVPLQARVEGGPEGSGGGCHTRVANA
jgi:hypothetical protein